MGIFPCLFKNTHGELYCRSVDTRIIINRRIYDNKIYGKDYSKRLLFDDHVL